MDNLTLPVWEINAGSISKFVVADSMETVMQAFYIGKEGIISLRPDLEPTSEMDRILPQPLQPLQPQKACDFTKLEKAALMMAKSLVSEEDWQMAKSEKGKETAEMIAKTAKLIAKAVLEEANK